ncbi:hypothetical protein AUJ66_08145 [Candidatus Desantisbacteria bacterium CG1_02_38_46]|uniref:BFN domain-containing protein n=3 Tax=unclassified Candidatus Desantisiibacteriota TaxID=3106372 RepID=A0A2H9PCN3_9BACT|nr:MAG: hypothetical protein AUJ66_08145 [Candidatus Desantisbacteria bacterium CG1_02_38_46]PIU51469.1 MAG: hypothetical protein COS91_04295 [Candidatus Desantisbacteria bacterium CG07_land_8_20_14_0_80_39_15]PIZ17065.1 MAG: hypothetical protein COY51_01240 [Candidatus Desantisbacteria bacterium CG_4_10_14_0_8_um_filter_39_17]
MIQVKIEGVVLDLKSNLPIIMLKDDRQRLLPISVGIFEAQAIAFALEKVHIPRPLTHDLISSIIEVLGSSLLRVEITELKGNTYFAWLVLKTMEGEETKIDSRPSDAIAIALRLKASIYANESLLIKKEIRSRPIDDNEIEQFKDMLNKLTPNMLWKYLKEKI